MKLLKPKFGNRLAEQMHFEFSPYFPLKNQRGKEGQSISFIFSGLAYLQIALFLSLHARLLLRKVCSSQQQTIGARATTTQHTG